MNIAVADVGSILALAVSLIAVWRFIDYLQKEKVKKAVQDEKMENQIIGLSSRVDASCKDSDTVPALENRVRNLEEKTTNISMRLSDHDTRSADISGRLTKIETTLENMDRNMNEKLDGIITGKYKIGTS